MTAFAHDVTRASLPVAIGLLALAMTAAAALWAPVDDTRALRLARQYLEPLSTWCLIALGAHVVARGAAGELDVLSLALPLILGAVAAVLRWVASTEERATPDAEPVAPPPSPTAPAPAAGGPLWAGRDEGQSERTGLWTDPQRTLS